MAKNSSSDVSFNKQEGIGNEKDNYQMIRDERQKSLEEKPVLMEKPLSSASLSSQQIEEGQLIEAVEITAAGPARFQQDDQMINQMKDILIRKLQSTTKIDDSIVQESSGMR